ncbi:MAG: hypothetical protein E7170_04450 [Firmicutes bacterium]|nr:hypothetical protein [Bacillota bacterium]
MKLINQFKNKIEDIEKVEFEDEQELEYFTLLSKRLNVKNELFKLSNSEKLKMLFMLERKNIPFSTIEKIVNNNKNTMNFDVNNNLKDFLILVEKFDELFDDLEILNYIVSNRTLNINEIVNEFADKTNLKFGLTEGLIQIKKQGLKLFETEEDLFNVIEIVNNSDLPIAMCIIEIDLCKTGKIIKEFLDSLVDKYYYDEIINKIKKKVWVLTGKKNDFIKSKKTQISIYEECIKILEKLNDDEIVNYNEEIIKTIDEDLAYQFMIAILSHNRINYSKLKTENLKNGYYSDIEKLFLKNNININVLDEKSKTNLLKNADINKIESIINYISTDRWNWLNPSNVNFVNIILNSSIENFELLNYYLDNKIITKEFIKENYELLLNENSKINLFKANIYLFRKVFENIDNRFIKNEDAYLVDNEKNLSICEMLKKYQINLKSENIKYFSGDIFVNSKILDDIDGFIELGFYDYIKDNSHMLKNESKDILTRLSIMLNIGLNPYSKEDRLHSSITSGKNFYVSQKELDNYKILTVNESEENKYFEILDNNERIFISSVLDDEIVKYLDSLFKTDEIHYVINDYYISRNKFLRNLECLYQNGFYDFDAIYTSLVYNSCLDDGTLEYIRETIRNYKGVKKIKF